MKRRVSRPIPPPDGNVSIARLVGEAAAIERVREWVNHYPDEEEIADHRVFLAAYEQAEARADTWKGIAESHRDENLRLEAERDTAQASEARLREERDELAEKALAVIGGLAKQFPQVRDLCEQMGFDPAALPERGTS